MDKKLLSQRGGVDLPQHGGGFGGTPFPTFSSLLPRFCQTALGLSFYQFILSPSTLV